MKVCTDACVFGAWAEVTEAKSLLDIGTGTGLLSLMVAQRNPRVEIHGVEVDEDAHLQTVRNFETSPFARRLKVYHTAIQAFFPERKYDCIISNPPFFQNDLRSPDLKTNLAHHADSLTFLDLMNAVERLLLPGGEFHVLLPVTESVLYQKYHSPEKWTLVRELLLRHKPEAEPFRRMMTFRYAPAPSDPEFKPQSEELVIYDEKGVNYDPFFKDYLKAFYLAF